MKTRNNSNVTMTWWER